jgi:hypothetical protein
MPERLPLQQFHGDEGTPIGLIDLVDRADVRVVQRGRSLSLALETAEGLRVVGEVVGKELQGDVATELEVFGLVHYTHATAANLAEDAVMGNRLPHGLGGRGHWVDMLGGGRGEGQCVVGTVYGDVKTSDLGTVNVTRRLHQLQPWSLPKPTWCVVVSVMAISRRQPV